MKTRKISKQSLVIAVLSLLLVLSMGLYATGAYFTDGASTTGDNRTLTFGTVNVDAEYTPSTVTLSYEEKMVPGDQIVYTGSIDPSSSTVGVYVLVRFSFSVELNDGTGWVAAENLYDEDGDAIFTIAEPIWYIANAATAEAANTAANQTAFTTAWGSALTPTGKAAGDYMYELPTVGTNNVAVKVYASVTLDASCPNVVYKKTGTPATLDTAEGHEIYLNIGEGGNVALKNGGTAYQIRLITNLKVSAVQNRVAGASFGVDAAYTELVAKLPA